VEERKEEKRSDDKTGKCKGWKEIPKRELEEIKRKRNGRTMVRELIWCEGEEERKQERN
jgi:hypothetical protein